MPSAPLISTFVETVQRYENGGYANLRDEFKVGFICNLYGAIKEVINGERAVSWRNTA